MAVTDFDPETRLQILNQELAKAREIIADLDTRKLATQHQVLRIEGAIALIGEILAAKPVAAPPPTPRAVRFCPSDRCDLEEGHSGSHMGEWPAPLPVCSTDRCYLRAGHAGPHAQGESEAAGR